MTQKQIVILCGILGVLALGIFLKSWIRSAGDSAEAARAGRVAFSEFDSAKLERILIGRPAKTGGSQTPAVELTKENGVWKVKSLWSAQADPVKVEALIREIRSAQGELRGSGKKLFEDFGIQEGEAFSIQLFGAKDASLLDFRVGTKQAGENVYFIRKASSENIYLVEMNLAELLGIFTDFKEAKPDSLFWADRSLFNLDPEKVTRITVDHVKNRVKTMTAGFGLVKDPNDPAKNSWIFLQRADRSYTLDPEKVLRFIATLNSVKAQKVVDPAGKDYGLENPDWEIAVTEGGTETILSISGKNEKEKGCFVKISRNPGVFILGATYTEDLEVDDARFAKEASKEAALGAKLSKSSPQSPVEQTS